MATLRVSRTTVARLSHGCLAADHQSPTRAVPPVHPAQVVAVPVPRVAASSSPCTATDRARLSPVPRTAGQPHLWQWHDLRITVNRSIVKRAVNSHKPNGHQPTTSGPTS
jgi:hypothetical protein